MFDRKRIARKCRCRGRNVVPLAVVGRNLRLGQIQIECVGICGRSKHRDGYAVVKRMPLSIACNHFYRYALAGFRCVRASDFAIGVICGRFCC